MENKDPKTARRNNREKNREIRHLMYGEQAKKAVGQIYQGMEIYGLSKGQFSIINIIEEILKQTGTADVVISTWTAANAEIKKAERFLDSGLLNRLTFIVDRSFPTRQREYYNLLCNTFEDSVYITNTHAKFILIKNDDWNIVIRTSMNLNENKRLENFEISDDKVLFDYLVEICDDVTDSKIYNVAKFEMLGRNKKYSQYRL